MDATKKFEKLITDKKDVEGLPATALGLAAQTAVSKVLYVKTHFIILTLSCVADIAWLDLLFGFSFMLLSTGS